MDVRIEKMVDEKFGDDVKSKQKFFKNLDKDLDKQMEQLTKERIAKNNHDNHSLSEVVEELGLSFDEIMEVVEEVEIDDD